MNDDSTRLKDIYFNAAFLTSLAKTLEAAYPSAKAEELLALVEVPDYAEMALKERMHHITRCMHELLPADFPLALELLLQIAPEFTEFDGMVFSDYVALYGQDHWDLSLAALAELTCYVSAEFAVRPYLRHDLERTLNLMRTWAAYSKPAVRRLASEGCRPRLPWGISLPALKRDPLPILPILDALKEDPDEAVRRSVANNLNDIAKDHPELVLSLAQEWYGQSPRVDGMLKHACRTLLKDGDPQAMLLFGFADPDEVQVKYLSFLPPSVSIGEHVVMHYDLVVNTDEPLALRLEYAVTFVKAFGKFSRKVFHQREQEFGAGRHAITKKHSFRDLSTRKHYAGEHLFEVIVNGVVKARGAVLVRESCPSE